MAHFGQDLDVIFSNIIDIQELTANLLNSLEETQEVNEMTEKDSKLTIGTCFDELLEVWLVFIVE